MTPRSRALAHAAVAVYFAACLLLAARHDAPPLVTGAAAWGLGASLALSAAWWGAGR